jgi:hypothetical protein
MIQTIEAFQAIEHEKHCAPLLRPIKGKRGIRFSSNAGPVLIKLVTETRLFAKLAEGEIRQPNRRTSGALTQFL